MRESYKTKQKELIKKEILSFQKEFTIKELFTELNQKDQAIGLTTIYRTVNSLVKSKKLSKSAGDDGILHYHITEHCDKKGHCLLKCESCGKLTHADCDEINAITKHFRKKHHFEIDEKDITINGICENCRV